MLLFGMTNLGNVLQSTRRDFDAMLSLQTRCNVIVPSHFMTRPRCHPISTREFIPGPIPPRETVAFELCVRRALLSPVSHRSRWNTERKREWRITNGKREKSWSCEHGGRRGRSSGFPECQNKNRWVLEPRLTAFHILTEITRWIITIYCENLWIFIQINT